jgi:hypothetical protein
LILWIVYIYIYADKEHSLFTSEVFNLSIDNKGFIKFDNGYCCCIHWVHWLNCSQILSS